MEIFGFVLQRKQEPSCPFLKDAIEEFMTEKARPGKWAGKTVKNYRSSFSHLVRRFPGARIDELTRDMLQVWIDGRIAAGIKPWTVQKQCVHISHLFNWVIENRGYIKHNPMTRTEKPTPHRHIKPFLNEKQIKRLLNQLIGIKYDITYIYLRTAMRPGELLCSKDTLNWTPPRYDADNKMILLDTTKTGEEGRIPLIQNIDGGHLLSIIEKYTNPAGRVVIGMQLEMFRQSLRETFWGMGLADLGYDVQCLRRSAGYLAWRYTRDIETCRKFLRHSNIETTVRFYVDLLPDDIREGLEKIHLEGLLKHAEAVQ